MDKVKLIAIITFSVVLSYIVFFVYILMESPCSSYAGLAELNGLVKYRQLKKSWPKNSMEYNNFLKENNYNVYEGDSHFYPDTVRAAVERGVDITIINQSNTEFSCIIQGKNLFSKKYPVHVTAK
jgi:hypothetical protein